MDFNLDDVVKFKKNHPCGSYEWTVIRTGSDYKLKCNRCDRIILLDKDSLVKKLSKTNQHKKED